MTAVIINIAESHIISVFLFAAPLVMLLLSFVPRFRHPNRLAAFNKRLHQLPILLVLIIYYGVIYQMLYFNQFYTLKALPDDDWVLLYRMPHSSRILDRKSILKINLENLNTDAKGMARIQIMLEDGELLHSARLDRKQAENHVAALNKIL